MKAVIMAGGKGSRMGEMLGTLPKPMLPLLGKPLLEREIEVLRKEGFTDIILTVGFRGEVIENYFGNGEKWGVHLTYYREKTPLGTAGALYFLKEQLAGDDFLLLCGDLLFDVDLKRFLSFHRAHGGMATIFTHPNTHPFDSVRIEGDGEHRVRGFLPPEEERTMGKNRVNAGLHFFSPKVLSLFTEGKKTDLDREILTPLATAGRLFYYDSPEYVKDMGTPARFKEGERDLEKHLPQKKNLKRPQAAVFLDRDGTVNRFCGYVRAPEDVVLLPRAAEAVRLLNEAGYPVYIVTNQPVIARGEVTEKGLFAIHCKLEALLGEQGAYLNGIYYCPHHPDSGFAGEVKALKIPCNCRKPAPGLLLQAAEEHHIDLAASYMVGDRETDMEAGRRAGCRTAGIGENLRADFHGKDLYHCVTQILTYEEKRNESR